MNRDTQNHGYQPVTDLLQRHSINSLMKMGMASQEAEVARSKYGSDSSMGSSSTISPPSIREILDMKPIDQALPNAYQSDGRATPNIFERRDNSASGEPPRMQPLTNYFNSVNSAEFNRLFENGNYFFGSSPIRGADSDVLNQRRDGGQEVHLSWKCVPITAPTETASNNFAIQASVPNGFHNGYYNRFSPEPSVPSSGPSTPEKGRMVKWEGKVEQMTSAVGYRRYPPGTFSPKVFLGGLPWRISEADLHDSFRTFGSIMVEWPDRKENGAYVSGRTPRGYAYIRFENDANVKRLLSVCSRDTTDNYYFPLIQPNSGHRAKHVQVIPWDMSQSCWSVAAYAKLVPNQTVFVGGLHGVIGASLLAKVFGDLFGDVAYTGIDTDKHKYPIGSGRVTFLGRDSYLKAISASYVEVKTQRFTKKIQIEPYLEHSSCAECQYRQGTYFCRSFDCLKYYCRDCWEWTHKLMGRNGDHKRVMRTTNSKGYQTVTLNSSHGLSSSPSPSPFSSSSSQAASWLSGDLQF